MQTPIHTPDESATALGAFFCLVWLVILIWWLVAKSRVVADTVAWFRRKAVPARIFIVCAFLAVLTYGSVKSGGNEPQGMGMRPPAASAVEPTRPEAASPSLAVVSVWTNGVALRPESTNAVEITAFRTVGGTELGDWIETAAPFFAIGTNPVSRCYVSASGSVSFETMRRPPVGSALPDGTGLPVLCPLRAPLGMVPEARWAQVFGPDAPGSRFWHDALPGGGRVLTWENALVDRLPGRRVSLQVEMRPTGDSVFRYAFQDELDPPATNFVMGAQMGTNGVNALSILGTNMLAATVWNVDGRARPPGGPLRGGASRPGEPLRLGGDASPHPVSIADLLCTNGVLRTPATFEIRWKNTTGLDPEADTDNDGLTDWAETFVWGTDPNHADTDGDGTADNVEMMMGADPFDADEDGNGVPDGTSAAAWAAHPLWAVNSTNEANVFIVLNEPVPTGASAVLVLDDLAIPLRTPAFWSFAFVPGTAYDYRLVVSPGTTVNLSITNAAPVQTRGLPLRGEPGEEDTPIWDKGDGGVFDGESDGGKGKVAVADITYTWTADGEGHHFTNIGGVCLHGATRTALVPHAVPEEIKSRWELTGLYEEGGQFWLDVPSAGEVYVGTARLASDILREGELSVTFGAHRCDATEQSPFCSICDCYEPLDADIDLSTPLLTLKHENKLYFSIKHPNSPNVPFTNPHFEIQQQIPPNATWYPMGTSPWTARIAGTFLVRGFATVNGQEIKVGQYTVLVRFPEEAQMMADPTIQAHAGSLWSQTLGLCSETNRHELGCWIKLDTSTDSYTFSDTITGPPTPNNQDSWISLVPVPGDNPFNATLQDGSAVYVVGSLHTHTPTTHRSGPPRIAGPSPGDTNSSAVLEMPGLIRDYNETGEEPGKVRMGLPKEADSKLYPTLVTPRRPTPGINL